MSFAPYKQRRGRKKRTGEASMKKSLTYNKYNVEIWAKHKASGRFKCRTLWDVVVKDPVPIEDSGDVQKAIKDLRKYFDSKLFSADISIVATLAE